MSEQKVIHQYCNNPKLYRIMYKSLGYIPVIKPNRDRSEESIEEIGGTADKITCVSNGKRSLQTVYRKNLEVLVCIKYLFNEQSNVYDLSQTCESFLKDIEMECLQCQRDVMATGGCKRHHSNTRVLVTCVCGMTLDDPMEHLAAHSDIQSSNIKGNTALFREEFL